MFDKRVGQQKLWYIYDIFAVNSFVWLSEAIKWKKLYIHSWAPVSAQVIVKYQSLRLWWPPQTKFFCISMTNKAIQFWSWQSAGTPGNHTYNYLAILRRLLAVWLYCVKVIHAGTWLNWAGVVVDVVEEVVLLGHQNDVVTPGGVVGGVVISSLSAAAVSTEAHSWIVMP